MCHFGEYHGSIPCAIFIFINTNIRVNNVFLHGINNNLVHGIYGVNIKECFSYLPYFSFIYIFINLPYLFYKYGIWAFGP